MVTQIKEKQILEINSLDDTTTKTKENYEAKVQAKFEKINAQIDELKAKAIQSKADATIEYHNILEELQCQKDALDKKLGELQNSSGEAWKELSKGEWAEIIKVKGNTLVVIPKPKKV